MMRTVAASLIVVVITTGLRAQTPADAADSPAVRGRVVDAANGVALRRARVTILTGQPRPDSVFTDDEGTFAIGGGVREQVRLRVVKAGYAQALVAVASDRRDGAVVALARGAAIAGRVVDQNGVLFVGATVSARLVVPLPGAAADAFVQAIADTDSFGEYRLGALPPGRYEVAVVNGAPVQPAAAQPVILPVPLDDSVLRGRELTRLSAARTVDVGPGSVSEIDFTVADLRARCPRPAPRPADPAATAGISGTVRGPAGEPLACATVRLLARGIAVRPVTADERGHFTIDNLPSGTYRVEAAAPGYVSFRHGQRGPSDAGRAVTLRDRLVLEGVDVVLPRRSTISGTVADEHGEPIAELMVRALQLRTVDGRTTAVESVAGRTDDLGRYRLAGLGRGSYLVEASSDHPLPWPTGSGGADGRIFRSFYPGTADSSAAVPVSLDTGIDATSIDLSFTRTAAATVTGFVFDGEGRPFEGVVTLAVSQRSGAVGTAPRLTRAGADGAFSFAGVPPGDYVVQAMRSLVPWEASIEFGMQYVAVGAGDPPPVAIQTSSGATVEGRLIVEALEPDEDAVTAIGFSALPADWDRSPMAPMRPEMTRQLDGQFRITGVTGPRRFAMTGAPFGDRWYLKSVVVNGADALDVPFDFGMAETTFRDVEVVVSDAAATIDGQVDGDWSAIASDVEAVAFSVYRDLWFQGSRHVKAARVAQDGTFRITGLPPGDYFVALSETVDPRSDTPRDAAALDAHAATALRVTVEEREQRSVILRVE